MTFVPTPALNGHLPIGVLGGSFNPAHQGHVDITQAARRALGLARCWWLVSPQNPLKNAEDYISFESRIDHARAQAGGRAWLSVTDLERRWGLSYTADTMAMLRQRFPRVAFVWIMGADSFAQLHRWDRWQQVVGTMPLCVVSRPGFDQAALNGVAARTFAKARRPLGAARSLAQTAAPAWIFLPTVHNPISATQIRAGADGPRTPG